MSRYTFKGNDETTNTVGWDNPLQTLFGDVEHVSQEDPIISTMIGMGRFDIRDVDTLEELIGYDIPKDIRAQLESDMAGATEPTPLQQRVRALMENA